ncbi:MAG: helix-hairpin-helix domain-containing protein [candidate division WOR-3 bacterium]
MSSATTSFSIPTDQLDINRASRTEIMRLPIDSTIAERIWELRQNVGRLSSIYDLMQVRGMNSVLLEQLKPLIYVSLPPEEEGRLRLVHRLQRELASEEGPTSAAVEDWQDMLLTPLNINRATVDDLLVLQNVSLVDAVAVRKYLESGQTFAERRDLANRVVGLSSYGYRNIRDFVTYQDLPPFGFGGNYRVSFETDPNWELVTKPAEFSQALAVLTEDSVAFREAGFTPTELDRIRTQLETEQAYAAGLLNTSSVRNRLRVRVGDHVRAGGWLLRKLYQPGSTHGLKLFANATRIGPLKKLFIGDYRVTIAQGLLLDNNAELAVRNYNRAQGIFSDLSENQGFGFRGGAAELMLGRLGFLGFGSSSARDAILNPDGTVNYYIVTTPRYPTFKNVLGEKDVGGSVRLDLSNLLWAPTGTRLGFNALAIEYDKAMNPDPKFLDVPGDAEVLDDPNYTRLFRGSRRLFYGVDARTAFENVSLEGELALQPHIATTYLPTDSMAKAYLVKARVQYDYLYVNALYRHYDLGYDNPYNRGYCEQLRFEDTPLERSYRLIDPAYAALQNFPIPKAEQGFLLDMRYQVSRQITFTRAYVDIWRNLAWGVDNYRFQGEVEWRPVFPVRLRLKQKLQSKGLPKPALSTRSFTSETSIRTMASLTDWDFLTGEVREGRVYLTPSMEYTDQASMSGNFLAVQWDHNFSDDFNAELGIATWLTRNMSQWIFEDTGIDFLEGDGLKWYLALSDRISKNMLLYFKVRHKVTWFPHTGLGNSRGIHYPGGSETVRDFVSSDDGFAVSLQLDLFW